MDVVIVAVRVLLGLSAVLVFALGHSVCRRWTTITGRDQLSERSAGAELVTAAVFVAVPTVVSSGLMAVAFAGVTSAAMVAVAWSVPMIVGLGFAVSGARRRLDATAS